ncbi:unnamed protein product [Adineta steineri]|uniref:Uncharacterized protein n=1 Tax=Adineta steineri TaxID=433720 RepID=A0A814AEW7_9BILA|nr:unnamed protein product [Adineta steineri]CAF3510567.1 unnamed protein product [Adineta steineri]
MGFAERFPRWTSAVLAIIQLALTVVIIGLEIKSIFIDLAHGTIWVGFWASLIFIKTLVMMLFITCCCRGRCCATYVLAWNIFSGILACVTIYFDRTFINDPCKCYLGDKLCCAVRSVDSFRTNYTSILNTCIDAIATNNKGELQWCSTGSPPYDKVQYLKAQLGCAVGMLISCALYVVIYIFACLGICFGHD